LNGESATANAIRIPNSAFLIQNSNMRLILASASPRRAELLRAAGFTFDIVVADVDESIHPDETPAEYVRRLAAEKSAAGQAAVARVEPPAGQRDSNDVAPIVLGADTTVVVDGQILGKPRDDGDAAAMLRRLSGRCHDVLTGISLRQGALEAGRVDSTAVHFLEISEAEVAWYVGSGEGRDKAGAYAIQGLASRFIPRIDGSYANVVGLPVASVAELLRSLLA
jgi:septum formation protein